MFRPLLFSMPLVALLCAGCSDDHPCDPGQTLQNGYCAPAPGDGDAQYPGDFGKSCTDTVTNSECVDGTNYCAMQPGTSAGYCTVTGCDADPSLCPAGWTCFDLSQFQAGLPFMCSKP